MAIFNSFLYVHQRVFFTISKGTHPFRREVHWSGLQELGYIVPEEVAESDMKFPHWTTEIRLPFKKELGNDEKVPQFSSKTVKRL